MLHGIVGPIETLGLAGLTAFALVFFLTPVVRSAAVRLGWIDKATVDRWGKRVTARLGGVAMFLGFLGATLLWVPWQASLGGVLTGVSLVFVLGLTDDLHRLPPYTKLIAQLLIGCVVVISGIRIDLIQWPWFSIPLSVLWFALIMNAFNLLDNMDGLAAGIGAMSAGFCAFHAAVGQQWLVAVLSVILCGTCVGFLRFNFPPAKIYMGDSGSHFIGLGLAVLALLGTWRHSTQLLSVLSVPVLVLAVPIFDTCFVAIQRISHRQHPFAGGTDHLSHRLAILGLSTRQTVITLYAISACLGLLSVVSVNFDPLRAAVLWLVVLTGLLLLGGYLAKVNVYRVKQEPAVAHRTTRPVTRIETMLLHKRRLVEIVVDFCLISSAYVLAHLLRFDGVLTRDIERLVVQSLPVILVIKLACFAGFGLYRGVWRYFGLPDMMMIVKAVTLGSMLSALALLYLWRFQGYSRAVLVIDYLVSLFAIGASRVAERLLDESIARASARRTPVVILGAGETGAHVLRSLRYDRSSSRHPVGFLDDDVRKHGSSIHRVVVLGGRAKLADVINAYGVREVLIAINDPPGDLLQHVQQCCEPRAVAWRVVTAGVTSAL